MMRDLSIETFGCRYFFWHLCFMWLINKTCKQLN